MQNVMMKAQALAEAILETGMYQKMQDLEAKVTSDPEATAMIADYVEKRDAFENLMRNQGASKEEFASIGQAYAKAETAMSEHALIAGLRQAQQEYSDLMDNVNRIIRLVVTGETEEGGCSGNCSSCGGCHH